MAENITTLLELLEAGTLSEDDVIYIVHGSGTDRDRKLKLSKLRVFCGKVCIDEDDDNPGFLTTKFNTSTSPEFGHGDVRFLVVNTRGGREMSTEIRNNTITTAMLKEKVVTNDKIEDNTITSDKIKSVSGDNLEASPSKGSKQVTITGGGSASTVIADIVTLNPVGYRGLYDFTVGFKNIGTYPLSHAVIKLIDQKGNLVDSFDFSGYTDQEWHYGRIVGTYTSVNDGYSYNLYLKLEGDTNFSGSRSPYVSWRGYCIE